MNGIHKILGVSFFKDYRLRVHFDNSDSSTGKEVLFIII